MKTSYSFFTAVVILLLALSACTVTPNPGECTGWTEGSVSIQIISFNMLENGKIDDFKAMVKIESGGNLTIDYVHPKEQIDVKSSGAFSYTETGTTAFSITGKFTDPASASVSYSVTQFDGTLLDYVVDDMAVTCQ